MIIHGLVVLSGRVGVNERKWLGGWCLVAEVGGDGSGMSRRHFGQSGRIEEVEDDE